MHQRYAALQVVVAWVASRWGGWSATLGVMLLSAIGVAAGLGIARYERKLSP
jgi:hypothetical protein